MLRGDDALYALDKTEKWAGSSKNSKKDPPTNWRPEVPTFSAPRDWEKFAAGVMGPKTLLSGICLLPISRDAPPPPAGNRKAVMYARRDPSTTQARRCHSLRPGSAYYPHRHAQKGISLKPPEAAALVDAIMDGRVHKDYVYVGGQQCACRAGPPCVLCAP